MVEFDNLCGKFEYTLKNHINMQPENFLIMFFRIYGLENLEKTCLNFIIWSGNVKKIEWNKVE